MNIFKRIRNIWKLGEQANDTKGRDTLSVAREYLGITQKARIIKRKRDEVGEILKSK